MSEPGPRSTLRIAANLAAAFEKGGHEYALGGAIALGFWGVPRGTLDVDVTLFMPAEQPSSCVWLLQDLGCEVDSAAALASLRDHGFCRARYQGIPLDVFLPSIPFYDLAKARRRQVPMEGHPVWVWDAETLAVFKMMFFRRKDFADIEQMLRTGGTHFDRAWVRERLIEIYGARDPRLAQWDELAAEVVP
jgi:hypothetical protein